MEKFLRDYFLEYWFQHRQLKVVIKKEINKDLKIGGEYLFDIKIIEKSIFEATWWTSSCMI